MTVNAAPASTIQYNTNVDIKPVSLSRLKSICFLFRFFRLGTCVGPLSTFVMFLNSVPEVHHTVRKTFESKMARHVTLGARKALVTVGKENARVAIYNVNRCGEKVCK